MLEKVLPILLAATLAIPAAVAAEPIARVDASPPPKWQNPAGDGYYLRVDAQRPAGPRDATKADDCAAGARPRDAAESADDAVHALLTEPIEPGAINGVSPWFPTCVAVTAAVGGIPACADLLGFACPAFGIALGAATRGAPSHYVAWNVATGVVYVETAGATTPIAFRLPFALAADCEDCPPPTVV